MKTLAATLVWITLAGVPLLLVMEVIKFFRLRGASGTLKPDHWEAKFSDIQLGISRVETNQKEILGKLESIQQGQASVIISESIHDTP